MEVIYGSAGVVINGINQDHVISVRISGCAVRSLFHADPQRRRRQGVIEGGYGGLIETGQVRGRIDHVAAVGEFIAGQAAGDPVSGTGDNQIALEKGAAVPPKNKSVP
ncbi:hypothetical protein ES703_26546 [subsurface metagenome]